MSRSFSARVRGLLQRRTLKSRLASMAKVVSCVAVFCISYVLIAPVLTQEWELVCGLEEHVHTDECYQDVWVQDDEITNNDSETDAQPETTTETVLTCTEAEGHTHDSGCYETVRGELTCTEEGTEEEPHEHTDSCYDWTEELTCTETEGHTHDDSCYETVETPVDSQPVDTEPETQPENNGETEEEGNGHWERVLVCELPEHTHDDSCYNFHEEDSDSHICGLEAHSHSADCYFENGELKCTLPEHTHTDECLAEVTEGVNKEPSKITAEDGRTMTAAAIDETFDYENDMITATISVKGNVFVPVAETVEDNDTETDAEAETVEPETEAADAEVQPENEPETEAQPETDGFQLVVTENQSDEKYNEFAAMAEENGEVMMLQVLDYSLMMGDEEINLDGCTVEINVEAKAELQQMMDAPIASSMYALESDGETEESESNEADADIMMELASFSDNDGSMAYVVLETDNPSFTVQYYAWLERAVMTDYEGGRDLVDNSNYKDVLPKSYRVPIINTEFDKNSGANNCNRGGNRPTNGNGQFISPNKNNIGVLTIDKATNKVVTASILTEIYKSENLTYKQAPGLMYFNIVNNNEKSMYNLKEIWILEDRAQINRTEDSTGWKVVPYSADIRFTNRPQTAAANSGYILIDKNAVIRLVYDPKETQEDKPANFYDYDITDGKLYEVGKNNYYMANELTKAIKAWGKVQVRTGTQGINSTNNYSGTGTKLGFGNANLSSYGTAKWGAEELNKANNRSFMSATYGLVKGLDANGHIIYGDGVDAPKLFNEGTATGKSYYDKGQYSLKFDRVGDTYTLKAVNGTSATNLDELSHPQSYTHIWTNNFWPMDSASSYGTAITDKHGTVTGAHDPKMGGADYKKIWYENNQWKTVYPNDDGKDHNSFFGMQYSVTFKLSSSYVGPLEYLFFGDDDMWVFLTPCDIVNDGNKEVYIPHYDQAKLVCDIGGVHTSVGEFVNLWDYINRGELLDKDGKPLKTEMIDKNTGEIVLAKDKDGNYIQQKDENGNLKFDAEGNPVYEPKMTDVVNGYMLSFFYTERGASGSTCWMQFTLPTVAGVNLESVLDEQVGENTGSISIEKRLDGIENNKWFEFTIEGLDDNFTPSYYQLLDANGDLIPNDDPRLTEENGYIIGGSDNRFRIRAGDVLALKEIPGGTKLVVTEIGEKGENGASLDGYQSFVTVNGVEQNTAPKANATIVVGKRTQVVYTNVASYELPATGGMGTHIFYIVGSALCLTALALAVVTNRRKESEN